jgi:FtsP/CotA-like multicopper oxidase with cupredoxin domain
MMHLLFAAQLQAAAIASVPVSPAPVARPNDNRVPAGQLRNGVLTLDLEIRPATWHPEGPKGVGIPLYAFAEKGREASAPGPMIRVPAGTEVRVRLSSSIPKLVRLRGLQDHTTQGLDTVDIAPGVTRELRFRADVPGTYYYYGRTEGRLELPFIGVGKDGQLHGVFIVDPAGVRPAANERTFVVAMFEDSIASLGAKSDAAYDLVKRFGIGRHEWLTFSINGLAWPHTERLGLTVGDTLPWRVINLSPIAHPMHLHGFYFDVLSRGDGQRDTTYTASGRRLAVTEPMAAGTTMRMRWTPTRAGNWLFHCHLIDHIDGSLRLTTDNGMAALVMAMKVSERRGAVQLAGDPAPLRRLRLHVTQRANVYRDQPGFSFILQEGAEPRADSIRVPSSTIVLRKNEPTAITVVNRTAQRTTVHWHGIELESYFDGVGDFSGEAMRLAPVIAPGDSFVVRLRPDRAGTFIYHTHTDESKQLTSGLYGALLVLDEGVPYDTTERVVLLGAGGPQDDAPPFVNGSANPAPIELRAGVRHRLRFVSIAAVETKRVRLLQDTLVQQWRPVAKDGAELSAHQASPRPAVQGVLPGETYDFELLRRTPEVLILEVRTSGPTRFMRIPVIVRP